MPGDVAEMSHFSCEPCLTFHLRLQAVPVEAEAACSKSLRR